MSNPESFIEEVTEEVRRDRLFALMRRYGWIAVLAVILIVGGAAYTEWQKARDTAAAQALGDALLAALEQDDAAARVAALDGVAGAEDAAPLVDLLAAGEQSAAGEDAAAIARLRALADDTQAPVTYRQLALLKLVLIEGETRPAEDRRADLAPLAEPGAPFRPLALEQLALLEIEEGNTEAAIGQLREILELPEATAGLRERATQLIVALGGTLEPA
ncbi:tetratricopeptide repeat protein [Actibacterium sp. MT2.3-13A]|uniref:tetratricopeptide repeat protein n=1 Tax=Actibacterium sp. MT2.3-13A TaxID=2828332 RepID=UPI001BA87618|nr:tetratricopeptide repeat protein [Actibacterium sp. MT2.3-13A]